MELHYVIDALGNSRRASKTRKSLTLRPLRIWEVAEADLPVSAMVYRWTCRICETDLFRSIMDAYAGLFVASPPRLRIALQKVVAAAVREDVTLIGFAQAVYPDAEKVYLVRQKGLLKVFEEDLKTVSIHGSRIKLVWEMLSSLGNLFLRGLLSRDGVSHLGDRKNWIIFQQIYSDTPENPEFLSFYEYFKERNDILYTDVKPGSWMAEFLRSEGKPILSGGWKPVGKVLSCRFVICQLARLCWVVLWGPGSLMIKRMVLCLKLSEIYYSALFALLSPRFIIRVRADMDPDHPIVTDLMERCGGWHVGYQHGNYFPCLNELFAFICFHAYGIWGPHYRGAAFSDSWPDDIPYPVLGPFTMRGGPSCESGARNDGLTIAVFPSSTPYDELTSYADYEEFMAACYYAASHLEVELIVKDKVFSQHTQLIENRLRRRYGVSVRSVFSASNNMPELSACGGDSSVMRSDDVINVSDLVIVMGNSSVAWEALSCKRKVLVYSDPRFKHYIADYLPQLVVESADELEDRVKWLLSMRQSYYENLVAPFLRDWCKENDANLVRSFWMEVERLFHEKKDPAAN